MEIIKSFDVYFLKLIHYFTNIPVLGQVLYFLADFVFLTYPVFLVGYWIYARFYADKSKETDIKYNLLFLFLVTALSIVILLIISKFELVPMRERPETSLTGYQGLIMSHLPDNSFPSNHATSAMAFCTVLFLIGWRLWGYIFFVFGFLSGFSRIAVGVHWPTDILAGIVIGFLLTIFLFRFKRYIDDYFSKYLIKLSKILKL